MNPRIARYLDVVLLSAALAVIILKALKYI
jgi:hypothetical protein